MLLAVATILPALAMRMNYRLRSIVLTPSGGLPRVSRPVGVPHDSCFAPQHWVPTLSVLNDGRGQPSIPNSTLSLAYSGNTADLRSLSLPAITR